jgi:hypothetical protein
MRQSSAPIEQRRNVVMEKGRRICFGIGKKQGRTKLVSDVLSIQLHSAKVKRAMEIALTCDVVFPS